MSKEESLILKGIAILMMVFYHLFCRSYLVDQCAFLLPLEGLPGLLCSFAKSFNPVSFYLMLSGYGLFAVNMKVDKNRWSRLRKLMYHYWVITIPFVLLGCLLKPDMYPGHWETIVANLTAFKCTYNTECWFLFPFLLLSIFSVGIYRICSKWAGLLVFVISFVVAVFAALSIYYLRLEYMGSHQIVNLLYLVATLQHPFVIGMLSCKYNLFNQIRIKPLLAFTLLFILMFVRIYTSHLWHTYYLFIALFLLVQFLRGYESNVVRRCLAHLGKHSLNIWMIHSWFCYHLFQDFIYALKYPFLIFTFTLGFSYLLSIIVESFFDIKIIKRKLI